MAHASDPHVKLVLRPLPSGQLSVINVKKSTADYLGWSLHFQTYSEWVRNEQGGGRYAVLPYRAHEPRKIAGTPIRIGRGPDMNRNEPGLTHIFRIGSKVSLRDLAELASFTEVDWHWMERPNRARMSRQWWWDLYQSTP